MVATQIELKHSALLSLLMIGIALLALVSIVWASVPVRLQVMLVAILLAGMIGMSRKSLKPLPNLRLKSDGQIQLSVKGADWQSTEVLPGSFVSAGLCVVRLKTTEGKIHALSLLPDSCEAGDLRRLRVSLRWASRTH